MSKDNICPVCGGLGEVMEDITPIGSRWPMWEWVVCEECDGWGFIDEDIRRENS